MEEEIKATDVNYIEGKGLFVISYGFLDSEEFEIQRILIKNRIKWWKIERHYYESGNGFAFAFLRIWRKNKDKMPKVFDELDNTLKIIYGKKYIDCKKELNIMLAEEVKKNPKFMLIPGELKRGINNESEKKY